MSCLVNLREVSHFFNTIEKQIIRNVHITYCKKCSICDLWHLNASLQRFGNDSNVLFIYFFPISLYYSFTARLSPLCDLLICSWIRFFKMIKMSKSITAASGDFGNYSSGLRMLTVLFSRNVQVCFGEVAGSIVLMGHHRP